MQKYLIAILLIVTLQVASAGANYDYGFEALDTVGETNASLYAVGETSASLYAVNPLRVLAYGSSSSSGSSGSPVGGIIGAVIFCCCCCIPMCFLLVITCVLGCADSILCCPCNCCIIICVVIFTVLSPGANS